MWTAAAAAPAVAAGFYLLAALRSKRSLHPTGVGYRGWLMVGDDHPGRPEIPPVSSWHRPPSSPCASPEAPACPSRYWPHCRS